MDLRQLRYFIAVAEALSFTKAAHRLNIAQPPLSRHIQQLEAELGVTLLLRDRRKVELTDAGRVLLHEARNLVNQAKQTIDVVRRAGERGYGIVRIGIASGLGAKVNCVMIEFSKHFPGVDLQCKDILSGLQNDALREREIDIGFLRPPVDLVHLISHPLFEEQYLVFLPKGHPLAKQRKLRLKQLENEPLLLPERKTSSGVYDKTLELYRKAGVSPKIIFTSTAPYEEAGAILLASGKGIYVGVGAIRSNPSSGSQVATVPLDEPGAKMEVHVAWRKGESSSAVLAFIETVRRVFGATKQPSVSSTRA